MFINGVSINYIPVMNLILECSSHLVILLILFELLLLLLQCAQPVLDRFQELLDLLSFTLSLLK